MQYAYAIAVYENTYVTGFGKMFIVQTSNFDHLEIYKNHRQWYTDLKLSGIIKQ